MTSNPRYLLGILFLISVINYLDRQVLAILQEDIKHDLSLTDTQLGELALGFGIVYALCAMPIGRLADSVSRKGLIIACMSAWSAITSATMFVQSHTQLLLTRMGVAVGEAGVNPTSHSMISDTFPVQKRATAIAVFGSGIPVGIMLSIMLGGLIAEQVGWRYTFLFFGIPGLLLALVMFFTIREPKRGAADGISHAADKLPLIPTFGRIWSSKGYVYLVIGAAAQAMFGFALLQWFPSYYIRTFGVEKGEIAITLGLITGITGVLGIMSIAYLGDRLARADVRWYLWILAISVAVATPFLVAALFADNLNLSMALAAVPIFAGTAFVGISNALVQGLVPVRMRGMAAAIKTLSLNIVGFGMGGFLLGFLSDFFKTDVPGEGLRYAILTATAANVIAIAFFLLSARYVKSDLERARLDSEATPSRGD